MRNLILLALSSASQALKGEKALKQAGIPCALVSVPRRLSAHCGVGLRVASSDREAAEEALEAAGIPIWLLCGTCLSHFGLKDKVAAGETSNMFAISETLLRAAKVITL